MHNPLTAPSFPLTINQMVNSRTRQLDEMLFALSDPTRRAIVARLAQGDCTVAEIAEPFEISPPAISKHLRVLQRAGLLTQRHRLISHQSPPTSPESREISRGPNGIETRSRPQLCS